MFFADPAAAFGNLAGASGPVAGWSWPSGSTEGDGLLLPIPLEATRRRWIGSGCSHGPPIADGTGPFSLSDPGTVGALLAGAGWRQVEFCSDRRPVYVGGPGDPEHVADSSSRAEPSTRS